MKLTDVTRIGLAILLTLVALGAINTSSAIAGTQAEPPADIVVAANLIDLGTTRALYTVANAHLDTQWNWTVQTTINDYIPKTLDNNFALFTKYPNYNFNFEGAVRYRWAKEYYPDKYNTLKTYISQGRWNVAGSSWDAGDVNIPSPEGVFRNILYGNGYFQQEFGKRSVDIFLPDCFGFGWALPSIASHAGLKGFSTQKLSWGSAYGVPFDIGRWIGPDGAYIGAALKTGNYTTSFSGDLSNNTTYLNQINSNGSAYGVYAHMEYHGTGDTGGSPSDGSASSVNSSVTGTGPIKVLSASTDQLFRDLTSAQLLALPSWNNELVMTTHGTGSYTSRTISKRWNRQNELLADDAERAAVMASWLGGAPYPQARLTEAWERFVWHQFHDDLTGTSIPAAYTFSWNDYVLSLNQFAGELANGVGAIARAMDTQATGTPVVVYNPLAVTRRDVVETRVYFPSGVPAYVRVYDNGTEVPSQKGTVDGNYAAVIFLADMPSMGYKTFDVQAASAPSALSTGLSVTSTTLNSNRYTVTINSSGDISSIVDKANGNRQLLSSPLRLQMQNDNSNSWPSWEVLWSDVNSTPREYVSGSVSVSVVEGGPARVALKVTRTQAGSTFTQYIRLNAGDNADRVEVVNNVDWQTRSTLLKATFPLNVSNTRATYDLGLGTIQRGNNTSTLYEVPAQQWADITDSGGAYGVTIMNDSKYGWDKPNNNTLRLTLIHTPSGAYGANSQNVQDLGRNDFAYAIYGHANNWTTGGSVWQAARLNQPLLAFQTTSHTGALGKSYSFGNVTGDAGNPQVAVKAIKKAENSNDIIVRVQEMRGAAATNVQLTLGSGIASAREVNAQEDNVGSVTVSGGKLVFNIGVYQPKTFALTLSSPPTTVSAPTSSAVSLSYNKDVVSPDSSRSNGNFDGTNAIPAELFPSTITAEGITFSMGPTGSGQNNALVASGQSITLNASGYKRLYLLAASAGTDTAATFTINGTPATLNIQDIKANVGQWDQAALGMKAGIKREPVAWVATHLHTSTANVPYKFAYLFKYRIDLPSGVANPVLVLPSNSNILIFAMTLSNSANDDTVPAGYLYDVAQIAVPKPNLALNRPATADSSCNANEGPEKAVNGSVTGGNSDKWCSTGTARWLRVDLGASYNINGFGIYHAGAGGENASWNTKAFNIQLSTDGTNWGSAVVNVTNNTDSVTTHNIAATTARYVRLNITTPTQTTDAAARIYEFEVYGSTGPTPPPTTPPPTTPPPTTPPPTTPPATTPPPTTPPATTPPPTTPPPTTPPPSTNLALNKPTTADSSCNANEGPAKAVNGSWTGGNSDKWCSTGTTKWLRVDLGASYSIASFTVRHAGAGGESTTYNTRSFNIQLSTDGATWGSAVVNVTSNTASVTTHNITAAAARYVRLNVVTGAQSGANTARIYELEVYGTSAGGDTTDPQTGTITGRGDNSANGEGMAQAFDNNSNTKWLDFSPDSNRASWIQYLYPGTETHVVTQYTITSANDAVERDPYTWRLYGIDAGGNAILLDTRTAQTFSARFTKNTYTIPNSTAYRGYRLQIDSVRTPSTANSVQLAEIEFIGN